jgi:uncharacterized alkaline shock family protein YloU
MKMKVGTRIVFTVYILIVVVLSLFLLAALFGLADASLLNAAVNTISGGSSGYQFLYAAILIVLVIAGIALLFFGVRKETPKTARIADFDNGSILITVKALEELVEKYIREAKDVKGTQIRVVSYTDYIDIFVELMVKPDADIPELTKSVQSGLTEEIQAHTGIAVRKNKIIVMSIDDRMKTRVD